MVDVVDFTVVWFYAVGEVYFDFGGTPEKSGKHGFWRNLA